MPVDALIRADIDAARLRAHAAVALPAVVASGLVAVLAVWAAGAAITPLRLGGWLGALVLVMAARLLLRRAHRRTLALAAPVAAAALGQAAPHAAWLRRYRCVIALHGLVWGVLAWLPGSLADAALLAALVFVLVGLAIGAMALTVFDLWAALLFASAVLLPLAGRLVLLAAPLSVPIWAAIGMGSLLLIMLTLAGRRANRARQALAATQRAERQSADGARDAQQLLRMIFDHAGQGISVFGPDLRLRVWNAESITYTGLAPDQVKPGLPLQALLLSLAQHGGLDDAQARAEVDRQLAVLGDARPAVSRQVRADGHHIETRRNPLPGGGVVMFHADITEREASLAALAEQQRMLALVLERTEQGFWYIDNALHTTDANPAMLRMLRLERAQMLGRSIYDFVDATNRAIFDEHVRLRAEGHAEGYEIALLRSDGTRVHCYNNATPVVDAAGRKTGALGLFSDISAQKRAEQQIRLAGELLAQKSSVLARTLDSLIQGVLSVDPQGRCISWNRCFLELLQIPESLMLAGTTLDELRRYQAAQGHFGEQLERFDEIGRESHLRALRGEPEASGFRYQRSRADGTLLEIASATAADGSLVRTYTDVTARHAAEAALIDARDVAERTRAEAECAREAAERANRAKSEFLSRMSHELRTPMNAILGFGQLLEADVDDRLSSGQRARLVELLRAGRHLLALINDVLDVSRIEAGMLQLDLQPVDVAALAQECVSLVQPMVQARGVTLLLQFDAAARACPVMADPTRLRQVLLNLLSNAIKFNREAGQVRLGGRVTDTGLLIEVVDQGAGIPAEHLPRLFQAFERLDMNGAVEGTGIGLALSRSLVTLMHGEIGVHSLPGQGSTFWLRLPGAGAVAPRAPLPPVAGQPAAPGRRYQVLYIEDNEVNQLLMEGMLAHRPAIDLHLAALPVTGLAMAAAAPPDLVLLDIQLPGIDGFEVLRRLRDLPALCSAPVIAVSANAMPSDLEDARLAGFAVYLTKPVDMPRLLALIDRTLAAL